MKRRMLWSPISRTTTLILSLNEPLTNCVPNCVSIQSIINTHTHRRLKMFSETWSSLPSFPNCYSFRFGVILPFQPFSFCSTFYWFWCCICTIQFPIGRSDRTGGQTDRCPLIQSNFGKEDKFLSLFFLKRIFVTIWKPVEFHSLALFHCSICLRLANQSGMNVTERMFAKLLKGNRPDGEILTPLSLSPSSIHSLSVDKWMLDSLLCSNSICKERIFDSITFFKRKMCFSYFFCWISFFRFLCCNSTFNFLPSFSSLFSTCSSIVQRAKRSVGSLYHITNVFRGKRESANILASLLSKEKGEGKSKEKNMFERRRQCSLVCRRLKMCLIKVTRP